MFFSRVNLLNILDQWSATLIIAVAGTLVLIAGGFDLSVGSIYAFSGVIAALTVGHIGAWGAILLGVAAGLGCGVVNGIIATWGRINPFIATLATSIMIGGFALVLTGGNLISVLDNGHFTVLGRSDFETIKYSVWTLLAFTLLCGYLLSRTTYGRRVYASGGNPEAARLSGVRVNLVKASTFALSGTAGRYRRRDRLFARRDRPGRLRRARNCTRRGCRIVIGGTSILGGAGAIWRTVLGVLLLAMIGNGFNLLNVNSTYQSASSRARSSCSPSVSTLGRGARPNGVGTRAQPLRTRQEPRQRGGGRRPPRRGTTRAESQPAEQPRGQDGRRGRIRLR